MRKRFGDSLNFRTTATFAAFENEFFNLLLVDFPEARLEELERPVWQEIIGLRMWNVDELKHLASWVEHCRVNKTPLIIRIGVDGPPKTAWPANSQKRLKQLIESSTSS